jgi:hypothetical protein
VDWQTMFNILSDEERERGHKDRCVRARFQAWAEIMKYRRPSLGGAFWWW